MAWLSESVWLPPGLGWEDLEGEEYAKFHHLIIPIVFSGFLLVFREFLVQIIFKPLALQYGMSPLPVTQEDEAKQNYKVVTNRRRLVRMKKFCETGWRWVFYLIAHLGGLYCLYDKTWIWNTAECWFQYPFHAIDSKIWWYYMWEMALYWCLFFTQFSDIKRKDFFQMLIHHVATLCLLVFSWTNHMHRMGSFVLLIHDFADHWLELAKLAKYAGKETICSVVFVIFAVTWVYTRLSILPSTIIYSTIFEAAQLVEMFPVYYIFNFLMTLLQILHVVWLYYIFKISYVALLSGDVSDSRSDTDVSDAAEDCGGEEET